MGQIYIHIDRQFINEWFSKGFNLVNGKMKNWPDDAQFIGTGFDPYTGAVDFMFESNDFAKVGAGERYPRRNILFTQKHDVVRIEAELEGG